MNWYLKVLKNYVGFDGRARRSEYWMFTLFNIIFMFSILIIEAILEIRYWIFIIYFLAMFIPSIAVCTRRLHDIGKNGWWYFIRFVPFGVGSIWLLILLSTEGTERVNDYGENPKFEHEEINNNFQI